MVVKQYIKYFFNSLLSKWSLAFMSVFNIWHYLIFPLWIKACSVLLQYQFKIPSLPSTELFQIYVDLKWGMIREESAELLSLSSWFTAENMEVGPGIYSRFVVLWAANRVFRAEKSFASVKGKKELLLWK